MLKSVSSFRTSSRLLVGIFVRCRNNILKSVVTHGPDRRVMWLLCLVAGEN
jgi:hypothetical protein